MRGWGCRQREAHQPLLRECPLCIPAMPALARPAPPTAFKDPKTKGSRTRQEGTHSTSCKAGEGECASVAHKILKLSLVKPGREWVWGRGGGVGWGRWAFPNSCFLRKSARDSPGYRLHLSDEDLFSSHLLFLKVTKASHLKLSARLWRCRNSSLSLSHNFELFVDSCHFLLLPIATDCISM